MAALGMRVTDLATMMQQADRKVSAGQLHGDSIDINLSVASELDSVSRIAAIPVAAAVNGIQLRVGDITDVARSFQNPPNGIGFYDNQRTLYIAARADEKVRVDQWSDHTFAAINRFRNDYSEHIGVKLLFQQSEYKNTYFRVIF